MENNFKTLQDAVDSWNWDEAWKFSKWYHTRDSFRHGACVCFEESRYFIITHRECVRYRERKGQVVMYLDPKSHEVTYPQYLDREDVYNRAMEQLDLSNPEVDQEMRMGKLMDLCYIEDLDMWFDENVELEVTP